MTIVCQKCLRILKNNQWVVDVPPIEKASYTLCPHCQAEKEKPSHGMVYQQNIRDRDR